MLLELEDEEGPVEVSVVEGIGLEVKLDTTVDDEEGEDADELGDEKMVEEVLFVGGEESDDDTAVALKPAPTPGPENVPVAVLKTLLDCVTVGLL